MVPSRKNMLAMVLALGGTAAGAPLPMAAQDSSSKPAGHTTAVNTQTGTLVDGRSMRAYRALFRASRPADVEEAEQGMHQQKARRFDGLDVLISGERLLPWPYVEHSREPDAPNGWLDPNDKRDLTERAQLSGADTQHLVKAGVDTDDSGPLQAAQQGDEYRDLSWVDVVKRDPSDEQNFEKGDWFDWFPRPEKPSDPWINHIQEPEGPNGWYNPDKRDAASREEQVSEQNIEKRGWPSWLPHPERPDSEPFIDPLQEPEGPNGWGDADKREIIRRGRSRSGGSGLMA